MGSSAPTSSKAKKNSGEDRRKRKNPKSRKRRRVSSSPSSYSSDSDDEPRLRRSSRRKPEKRRGRDPKRSTRKKDRKARHRSVSSGDSLDESRSSVRHRDDRKGKFKKVKRGRKLNGDVRSSRSRNRSLSCSTCSGRDSRSNSPRRIHTHRDDTSKEMDGSRQIMSSSVIELRGDVKEMYGSGSRVIDNELIAANCDDLSQQNTGRDVERLEQDFSPYGREVEIDRWMCESNLDNYLYFDQFEDSGMQPPEGCKQLDNSDLSRSIKSEIVTASNYDSESDDLELMLRKKALENLKKLRGGHSSDNKAVNEEIVPAGDDSSEKSHETAKKIISSSESDSIISKQRKIQVEVPLDLSNLIPINKLPPIEPSISTSEKNMLFNRLKDDSRNFKQLKSSMNSQNTSNQMNITENSTAKMSYMHSPCRGSPEKNDSARCQSGNSLRTELSLGDRLASGNTFPIEKEEIHETNETVKGCQSGSQFEKKTFSRMHDGEMVQVSYKVYIPNKTPALARRKLQR